MTTQTGPAVAPPSRRIAAEIRAEMARQGISSRHLALTMGVSHEWVNRRISVKKAAVDLTVEEIDRFAGVLGVPTTKIIAAAGWLPRLDSNQQPFGYRPRRADGSSLVATARKAA